MEILFYTYIYTHTRTHTYLVTESTDTANQLVWPNLHHEAGGRERMLSSIPVGRLLLSSQVLNLSLCLVSKYLDGVMPGNIRTCLIFEMTVLIQLMSHWASSVFPK